MSEEIINRVAQSKLVTFDLEDYYPEGERVLFDISDWLYEGIVLKEKDFRASASAHDWSCYQDCYVALHCTANAIVPGWAYMLLAVKLAPYAKRTVQGSLSVLETLLYQSVLDGLDMAPFANRPVIIKGCSKKPVPPNAYLMAINKLQYVASSVMYGEACSSVPLFKKNNS